MEEAAERKDNSNVEAVILDKLLQDCVLDTYMLVMQKPTEVRLSTIPLESDVLDESKNKSDELHSGWA